MGTRRAYFLPFRFCGAAAGALTLTGPSLGLAAEASGTGGTAGGPGAASAAAPRFEVTRLKDAEECPDADVLEDAVLRTIEVAPPGLPAERVARTEFDVQFSRSDSGYTAILRSKEFNAERTLSTRSDACDPLADAVAIAVAVLLGTVGHEAKPSARPRSARSARRQPASTSPPDAPTDDSASDQFNHDRGDDYERKARDVVFAEFMGSGISDSINFEHFFEERGVASIRLGFGYTQSANLPSPGHQLTLPVLLELDSSDTGSHNFHFGTGVTAIFRNGPLDEGIANPQNTGFASGFAGEGVAALANVVVGYRYLPREPGMTLGLYAMGLFNFAWGTLWAGANLGYAF